MARRVSFANNALRSNSCSYRGSLGRDKLGDFNVYQYLQYIDVARWGASADHEVGYAGLRTIIDWLNVVFLSDDREYIRHLREEFRTDNADSF
jgi:hypothetical protein